MPKAKYESLWPSKFEAAPGFDMQAFLQVQAKGLQSKFDNAFGVVIEKRVVESVFIYNFTIEIPRLDYRYKLFSVRLIGDDFPARVEAPHLPESHRLTTAMSRPELEQSLKALFHDPGTARIVQTLADEGRGRGHAA